MGHAATQWFDILTKSLWWVTLYVVMHCCLGRATSLLLTTQGDDVERSHVRGVVHLVHHTFAVEKSNQHCFCFRLLGTRFLWGRRVCALSFCLCSYCPTRMEGQNVLSFLAVSKRSTKIAEWSSFCSRPRLHSMSLACRVLLPRPSSSISWQAVLLMFSSLTTLVKYFKTDHIIDHLIVLW